jgi:hypothetical protein
LSVIQVIKSRRTRKTEHVAHIGESRGAYRVLVGWGEGRALLRRPRPRWEDNIKMDLQAVGWGGMDWMNLLKPPGCVHQQLKSKNLYSDHTVLICFVLISEQTATSAPYNINWLVFITEIKSVYCAVQTGSVNRAFCTLSLKG